MSHNKIEIVQKEIFQLNDQLQFINLDNNKIKEIERKSFELLNKLTWLGVWENICISIRFKHKSLEKIAAGLTNCYPPICRIPIIANGRVVNTYDNATETPGDSTESFETVNVFCDPTFIKFQEKENQNANKCLEDGWQYEEWPECHSE